MEQNNERTDIDLLAEIRRRLDEKTLCLQVQSDLVRELEALNARLRDSERVKSGFLSNIRNEINNPLTSILGLSNQVFHGDVLDPDKVRHIAGLINKEAFNLDFQLRNIFSAAEIEAGEVTLYPKMVNIDELIQNQIRYFQFKSNAHQVAVAYQPTNGKLFRTDGALLQSIVMNLLANAINFSPQDQKVIITCQFLKNEFVLKVQDFGKGIELKDHKHVFERFKQLNTGTTKSHQGHGLGLSIVQEFAVALGGDIKIDSEVNKYTTLTLTLPEFAMDTSGEGASSDGQEIIFGDEEIL